MSAAKVTAMLQAYFATAPVTAFFSGFYSTPETNYHNTEEVEIDIVREDEDVSIVVQDIAAGYRLNTDELYTNKKLKPPVHKEAVPINSQDLFQRNPGENPFGDKNFRASLMLRIFKSIGKVERKIRRAIELQCAQVMQTGTVTMTDDTGAALFTVNYSPKATHFPTAATVWGQAGADPMNDIQSLADVIRSDGKEDPDQLIFGQKAFVEFLKNDDVKAAYDNRNIRIGTIAPFEMRGKGGQYRGTVEIGNYQFDIWTYNGRYKHPQTGVSTPYMHTGKVVVRSSGARMDLTFGGIPNIGKLLGQQKLNLLPEMPGRMRNKAGGMDMFTNTWLTADGEALMAGMGTRPLAIPTAIDTFGCLNTGLT